MSARKEHLSAIERAVHAVIDAADAAIELYRGRSLTAAEERDVRAIAATYRRTAQILHAAAEFDKNVGKMFASVQARRATMGFERTFKEAGGGQAGADAVRKEIERLAGAILKEEDVREAAARRNSEIDAQIERSMTQLHQVVGTQLTPKLVELIPHLVQLIPVFERMLGGAVKFATWLEANPLLGIGAIISAAVAKDIAAAAIGNAIKASIERAISGGGGGGIPGGGGGGKGGALDSIVAVAGVATMAERGRELYESTVGASERGEAASKAISTMSPSQRAHAALKAVREMDQSGGAFAVGSERIGSVAALFAGGPVGAALTMGSNKVLRGQGLDTADDRSTKYFEARATMEALERFNKSVDDASKNVAKLAQASSMADRGNPARNTPIQNR